MTRTDLVALACIGALLLTMAAYPILSRGGTMDADVARRPVTPLLGYWLRNWLMWVIAPLESLFLRARISPDVLNWAGVAFGGLAGACFAGGELSLAAWFIF